MKKKFLFLILLCVALLLTACHTPVETPQNTTQPDSQESTADTTETTTQEPTAEETTEPTEESTYPPAGSTPLSEDELSWFQNSFFAPLDDEGLNLHNLFLAAEYTTVKDIYLHEVFYNGIDLELNHQIPQEEIDLFDLIRSTYVPLDNIKVPKSEMERIFLENTGIPLEESNQYGLGYFTYLPEYDAFYMEHGDWNYVKCVLESGYWIDSDTVVLRYTNLGSSMENACLVTLQKQGDSYLFVSNVRTQ